MSRKLFAFVLSLLLATGPASADVAVPESAAGGVLHEWLVAFNSGELADIRRFNETHGQVDPAEDTLQWRVDTGGYVLVAIEVAQPALVTARLRSVRDPDEEIRATVKLEDAAAPPVLEFEPMEIPRLSRDGALAALLERLDEHAAAGEVSGAVLIARNDEVILRRAWGQADRAAGIANTPETQFRLGSANKMFTSVAILQLVEAGKVSLDATIDAYLPDFPNAQVRSTVTVRDLLTHQSGLVDIDFSDSEGFTPQTYSVLRERLRTHADYVAHYGTRAPKHAPRAKIEYNSFAFIVLGAIIERVSGLSYYDVVQARIFAPAGMAATGSLPEADAVPGRAVGYTQRGDAWVPNVDTVPYRGTAAGGGYSTVDDLLRFARALQAGTLVSPALLEQATTPQISEGWYGLGFITVGKGNARRYGHGGDSPGMNADVRVFPESGYVLVSLSNIDPPAAYRAFRYYEPRMPLEAK